MSASYPDRASLPLAGEAAAHQRLGGGAGGAVVSEGDVGAPVGGDAVGAGLEGVEAAVTPRRHVALQPGQPMGVPLPGVGQLVEDDVAQAGRVVEGRRPDPDRLVVAGVVDPPVAAGGGVEADPEVDMDLAPAPAAG